MAALTLRTASYTAASKTATGTQGASTILVTPNASGIVVGHRVSGTGIGTGAIVSSVNYNTNTITLSVANAGAVSGVVDFSELTKNNPLTNLEIDSNFTELRRDLGLKASADNPSLTNVTIGSGTINSTTIGATTPSTGAFTTLNVTSSTESTSTTTGALTVAGGVGIGGNVYANAFYGSGAGLTGIPNSALANSSITISGTSVPLGGSIDLTTAYIGSTNVTTLGTITTGVWNGTAIAIANGGTGSTSASAARTALGLAIGTNVQAYSATLDAVAGGTYTGATSITTVGTIGTGTWNGTAIAIANGGTGATTVSGARTNLGATTVGSNLFTLTNPSAIRFLRVNADNTVDALDAATFRTAIGAGSGGGSVTSVSMTVPTGFSVSGSPITASGTLAVTTTLSGMIKGTGSGFAAAVAGTDYVTPTLNGTLAANNNNITGIKTATFNTPGTLSTTSGAVTINWSNAQNYVQNEPTGAITYTFTAPPGVCHLQLVIDSDGTSTAQTITWPASVIWFGNSQWQGVNNKRAIINFWYDGTNYFAMGSNQV